MSCCLWSGSSSGKGLPFCMFPYYTKLSRFQESHRKCKVERRLHFSNLSDYLKVAQDLQNVNHKLSFLPLCFIPGKVWKQLLLFFKSWGIKPGILDDTVSCNYPKSLILLLLTLLFLVLFQILEHTESDCPLITVSCPFAVMGCDVKVVHCKIIKTASFL